MSPSRFLQLRQHPHAGFAKMRMDAGHEYLGMSFVFGDAPVQKLHPHWQVAIEDTSPMNLCVRREAHEFIRGAIPPNITRQQKPLSSSPRASGLFHNLLPQPSVCSLARPPTQGAAPAPPRAVVRSKTKSLMPGDEASTSCGP